MSKRTVDSHERHSLIARVLESPALPEIVPRLPPRAVEALVRTYGLDQCVEIAAYATPDQLSRVFDDDLWHAEPGREARFDAARFGEWLEALTALDPAIAADKLVGFDSDLVVGGLSSHVLVMDRDWLSCGAPFVDPDVSQDARAALHAALDAGLTCEFGAVLVIGTSRDSWDAVVAVLLALRTRDEPWFTRVLTQLGKTTSDWLGAPDAGRRRPGEDLIEAAAAERADRRDSQGYVSAPDAKAFLSGARRLAFDTPSPFVRDPLAAAYFREIHHAIAANAPCSAPAVSGAVASSARRGPEDEALVALLVELAEPPASAVRGLLGAAGENTEATPRLAAYLREIRAHDEPLHRSRIGELAYLANVVAAGASFQSRRPTSREAGDIVGATCNLGLETWSERRAESQAGLPLDLVTMFSIGWTVLYERVTLHTARRLREVLAEIQTDDRALAFDLAETRSRLDRDARAGAPWSSRPHLDVLTVLDPVSWAVVSALLDECPAVPPSLYRAGASRILRVTSELEFISEHAQIAWAHDYLESLPTRLVG